MPYYGIQDTYQKEEEMLESSDDWNFQTAMNGIFTMVDMTDYEDVRDDMLSNNGKGFNEGPLHLMTPKVANEYLAPQVNGL